MATITGLGETAAASPALTTRLSKARMSAGGTAARASIGSAAPRGHILPFGADDTSRGDGKPPCPPAGIGRPWGRALGVFRTSALQRIEIGAGPIRCARRWSGVILDMRVTA